MVVSKIGIIPVRFVENLLFSNVSGAESTSAGVITLNMHLVLSVPDVSLGLANIDLASRGKDLKYCRNLS